jgi:hypothetical protein
MPDVKLALNESSATFRYLQALIDADEMDEWFDPDHTCVQLGSSLFFTDAGGVPKLTLADCGCCCCRYWLLPGSEMSPSGYYFVNVEHTFTVSLPEVADPIPGEPAVRKLSCAIYNDGMGDLFVDGERVWPGQYAGTVIGGVPFPDGWYLWEQEVIGDGPQSASFAITCEHLDPDESHTHDPLFPAE